MKKNKENIIILISFAFIVLFGWVCQVIINLNKKPDKYSYSIYNDSTTESQESQTDEDDLYIDLNKADRSQLMMLDGIGETTANAIIEYRNINGKFNNIEELMNVSGIGEKKFLAVKDHIYVDDPIYTTTSVSSTTVHTTEKTTSATTQTTTAPPPETKPKTEPETEPVTQMRLEEHIPMDLNTASFDELMLLPKMTEETANEIISVREQIGGFSNINELLLVESLTQPQIKAMIDYVYVE